MCQKEFLVALYLQSQVIECDPHCLYGRAEVRGRASLTSQYRRHGGSARAVFEDRGLNPCRKCPRWLTPSVVFVGPASFIGCL